MHLLAQRQDLNIDVSTPGLEESSISTHMSGSHVFACIQAEATNATVQQKLQVAEVHIKNLSAPSELTPLTTAPAFIHVVGIIPLGAFQTNPRPLEVMAVELWVESAVQPALQLLHQHIVCLCSFPLITRGHHRHVVEDTISDDQNTIGTGFLAKLAKQIFTTKLRINLAVPQWLIAVVPLTPEVTRSAYLRRSKLDSIESISG
mmetsp:Transcript_64404/g.153616  ORF Transcript_64404/g.153616 Transcript_64404/m.153616 type:complete len:204 (+) Transcript_64404:1224-1835(+)